MNIKKVYKAFHINNAIMKYNPKNNLGQGNILAGIENLLQMFSTRPELSSDIGALLSVAEDLSRSYGQIPMQTIQDLEQRYERVKQVFRREESRGFRNPCFR